MFPLEEMISYSVQMDWGSVFVMNPKLKDTFLSSLRRIAKNQKIDVLPVDHRDWKELHEALWVGAENGAIVVLLGETEFPYRLAHLAYVFNKGDGLVMPTGGTRRKYGLSEFRLICWMTPTAWLSIHPPTRDDLARVTAGGINCYFDSPTNRDSLSVLEEKRWTAAKDPVAALKQANTLEQRHSIIIDLFPPNFPTGDFESHDKPLIDIVDKLTEEDNEEVQCDMLEIFAIHNDFYMAKEALKRGWAFRQETLVRLANAMARTSHIGGQRQYFWDLMKELAERGQPEIRSLMKNLLSQDDLAAENVLHVLTNIRPWADIMEEVIKLAQRPTYLSIQDLCRVIQRNAQKLGVPSETESSFSNPDVKPSHVGGLPADDYQHYFAVGREILKGEGKTDLEPELQQLAKFQAQIQSLEVGSYPKSILTFERAVRVLMQSRSWTKAVDFNHLGSVARNSAEYRIMTNVIEKLRS